MRSFALAAISGFSASRKHSRQPDKTIFLSTNKKSRAPYFQAFPALDRNMIASWPAFPPLVDILSIKETLRYGFTLRLFLLV